MRRFAVLLCSSAIAATAMMMTTVRAEGDAPGAAPEADSIEALAGPVKVDEFNPDVLAKDGSESQPVRGGVLRIRSAGNPKSLNPMCDSDSSTREVYYYLGQTLAARDRETFEWLPVLA